MLACWRAIWREVSPGLALSPRRPGLSVQPGDRLARTFGRTESVRGRATDFVGEPGISLYQATRGRSSWITQPL